MHHEIQPLNKEEIQLIESNAMHSILADTIRNQVQIKNSASESPVTEPEPVRDSEHLSKEFSDRDCLFFDIETTGLSADTSFSFLIGCICYGEGCWNRHQFIIRLVQEERSLLSSFFELAQKARFLIHFNGNTFDIPFLRKRATANGLFPPFDSLVSVDLYQRFRPLRKLLHLPHMNQSFLEKYVGWERKDQLSGKNVVALFWDCAASQNLETEQLLLGHNRDDLLGMLHVLRLEAYNTLFAGQLQSGVRAVITGADASIFPSAAYTAVSGTDLVIHGYLSLSFSTALPLPHPLTLTKQLPDSAPSAEITLTVDEYSGIFTIPLFCGTLRYYIPDYKNYYYLPLEHQAIHKSVATYVAKEYRIPAKPETCFVEKAGFFLPLPKGSAASDSNTLLLKGTPLFRESYEAKHSYFEYTEALVKQEARLISYITAFLKYFLTCPCA